MALLKEAHARAHLAKHARPGVRLRVAPSAYRALDEWVLEILGQIARAANGHTIDAALVEAVKTGLPARSRR